MKRDRTSDELDQLRREVAELTAELAETRQQQAATADVLKTINHSTVDLTAVLQSLVATAAGLCAATFAGIFIRKDDHLVGGVTIGLEGKDIADFMERTLAIDSSTASGRAVLLGRTINIADIEVDTSYNLEMMRRLTSVRAMLAVPLLRGGKAEGAFFLGRPEPGAFGPRQCELIQTFADQATIAIVNARLFEELGLRNRELSETLEQQTAASAILRAIAASPADIQPVLDTVVENAARLCEAHDAVIFFAEGDSLAVKAHHGKMAIDIVTRPIGRD